jgi:crotonobetainyl-CoA:carnitine CoA-transferase CaiB-like acyl-CoA transferase
MVSISGFGHESTLRDRGAFAPTMHAATGLLEYAARKSGLPVHPIADAHADLVTALHAAVGVLAALRQAERTGEGERVELAMYDAVLATYSETPFELLDPPELRPEPRPFDAGPHGWIAIAGPPQHVWTELRRAFPEIEDPTPPGADLETKARLRHAALEAWMRGRASREDLVRELEGAKLACAPVQSLREALEGPFARERDLLFEVDDGRGGRRRVTRLPYRFSRSGLSRPRSAPRRGEHNAEVLREVLELGGDRIRALEEAGVLLSAQSEDEG